MCINNLSKSRLEETLFFSFCNKETANKRYKPVKKNCNYSLSELVGGGQKCWTISDIPIHDLSFEVLKLCFLNERKLKISSKDAAKRQKITLAAEINKIFCKSRKMFNILIWKRFKWI